MTTTGTGSPLSGDVSLRINAARLVCVLLMMYVHVPNGEVSARLIDLSANSRLDHWIESFVIEGPGRASAALLSVVSGFLATLTLLQGRVSATGLYRRRFVSIFVPMICWASLTYVVYIALGRSDALFLEPDTGWLGKLNLVLFLTDAPMGPTLHLGFLRDLFVCVLLSPVLLMLLKRVPWVTLAVLLGIYLFVHSGQLVIILRPLVIFGFTLGMLLALRRPPLDALDRYWAWFVALTAVFAALIVLSNAGLFVQVEDYFALHGMQLKETVLYPLSRLSGSLAIWTMLSLASVHTMRRIDLRFSSYVFAAFCSHFLVLKLLFNGLWVPLVGNFDGYDYLIWFLLAPGISLLSAMVIVNVLARVYPPLARLVTGGRVPAHRVASLPTVRVPVEGVAAPLPPVLASAVDTEPGKPTRANRRIPFNESA